PARDLSAVQAATHFDFDPLRAKTQRLFDGFAHSAAESDALLQLGRDLLGLKLRIQLRFVDLLDRNQNLATGLFRKIAFQLINLRALATDDDPRTRRIDDDLQTICGALDIHVRDSRSEEHTSELQSRSDLVCR